MASRIRQKYRPGIDDPPPSRLAWLAGFLGLTAFVGIATAIFKHFKRN
jgi:hypothetical protein